MSHKPAARTALEGSLTDGGHLALGQHSELKRVSFSTPEHQVLQRAMERKSDCHSREAPPGEKDGDDDDDCPGAGGLATYTRVSLQHDKIDRA